MRASAVVKRQSTHDRKRCAPPARRRPPAVGSPGRPGGGPGTARPARQARSRPCSTSCHAWGCRAAPAGRGSRLASAGSNAWYSDAGVWVFGVVLHQHDLLGVGVVDVEEVLDAMRPVDAGAPLADHDVAPAAQRLAHQEQVAHAAALVLIILSGWPAGRDRHRRGDLRQELTAGLIQAHLRATRIVGPGVDPKHVLHAPAELGIVLGRDAPALLQPRLEAVCCKAPRTVSYDTDSTSSSSTSRSASSRSVQRLRPSGGALHASAVRYASCSPSRRRGYWRPGALRYTAASSTAATYFMRTRATVAGLTSSAAPMAASVQPGPASPWLDLSRTRAWVSALAGATPRPIMVCSRARSSSDRTTMCRLRTSASLQRQYPSTAEHETKPHITQVTT